MLEASEWGFFWEMVELALDIILVEEPSLIFNMTVELRICKIELSSQINSGGNSFTTVSRLLDTQYVHPYTCAANRNVIHASLSCGNAHTHTQTV